MKIIIANKNENEAHMVRLLGAPSSCPSLANIIARKKKNRKQSIGMNTEHHGAPRGKSSNFLERIMKNSTSER
jgi:hypothetical protein